MNETQPDRNPLTHRKHRKEMFWQITFPLILGTLVFIGLVAWTIYAAAAGFNIRNTADVSLVFLIIPAMVMLLVPLAILIGMVYGVIWLNKNTAGFTFRAQKVMDQIKDGVTQWSDKAVEPVIGIKSRLASFQALKRKEN